MLTGPSGRQVTEKGESGASTHSLLHWAMNEVVLLGQGRLTVRFVAPKPKIASAPAEELKPRCVVGPAARLTRRPY